MHDEYQTRQMIAQNLFEPILRIVYDTMPRDNLLNSACLELFEFIRRENLKEILKHLVLMYRERLEAITYVDTFRELVQRYDQMMEPATTQELDHSFTTVDSDTAARHSGMVSGGKWSQALKDMDPEEEDYFRNVSDDEEDGLPHSPKMNGASPVRPLVGYPDDDADEDEMEILSTSVPAVSPLRSSPTVPSQTTPNTRSSAKANSATPPERISEKRRREEDEEDELLASISISGSKRRTSISSTSSTSSATKLRRKNSMSSTKDSVVTPKKLSISLPLKSNGEGGKSE